MNDKDLEMLERLGRSEFAKYALDRPIDSTETPLGQKFSIGDKVKFLKDHPPFYREGDIVSIEWSYQQKYGWMVNGRGSIRDYCIKDASGNRLAWIDETELEKVEEVDS